MKERFTDTAWTEGDFNKATTSPSQTALQNSSVQNGTTNISLAGE